MGVLLCRGRFEATATATGDPRVTSVDIGADRAFSYTAYLLLGVDDLGMGCAEVLERLASRFPTFPLAVVARYATEINRQIATPAIPVCIGTVLILYVIEQVDGKGCLLSCERRKKACS